MDWIDSQGKLWSPSWAWRKKRKSLLKTQFGCKYWQYTKVKRNQVRWYQKKGLYPSWSHVNKVVSAVMSRRFEKDLGGFTGFTYWSSLWMTALQKINPASHITGVGALITDCMVIITIKLLWIMLTSYRKEFIQIELFLRSSYQNGVLFWLFQMSLCVNQPPTIVSLSAVYVIWNLVSSNTKPGFVFWNSLVKPLFCVWGERCGCFWTCRHRYWCHFAFFVHFSKADSSIRVDLSACPPVYKKITGV